MDVLTPNGLGATAATGAAANAAAKEATIGADFETFLVMLTAQMKNQDPLNPMDSQDFATQLATFSGVEQQVKTNDQLAALASQFATSNLGEMAGWVGMNARIAIPGDFDGTPIEIVPNHASGSLCPPAMTRSNGRASMMPVNPLKTGNTALASCPTQAGRSSTRQHQKSSPKSQRCAQSTGKPSSH